MAAFGGTASNHTTTTGYWSTSASTTWPDDRVTYYIPTWPHRTWMDAWLDRYVRACRRLRRRDHLEALRSLPTRVLDAPARGLPKTLLWLSRVVRKGA
jgi:hypothetical protein